MRLLGACLVALAGCDHSEPFGPQAGRAEEPFDATPPVRLTYAIGRNTRPAFSEDERRLVYSLSRPDDLDTDEDHDACLGVLPTTGGARVALVCSTEPDHRTFRDGFEHGALSNDGRLAFVRASGRAGNPSAIRASLHVGDVDSVAGARHVLELKRNPPAGAPWDYLLNPAWIGPGELLALAVRTEHRGFNANPDTLYFGIAVVRLRVDDTPVTWTTVAPGMGASEMAFDRSTGMVYLLAHTYVDDDFPFVLADAVYRVPVTGGTPVPVAGLPRAGGPAVERLLAIAAGGGRLLASRGVVGGGGLPVVDVVELGSQLDPQRVPITLPGNAGRIALTRDGRTLVAEVFMRDGIQLYRVAMP